MTSSLKVAENSSVHAVALARGLTDDLTHLRDKAHIEHAVGFVQYQHFQQVQVHLATVAEVQQAAWVATRMSQ